MVLNEVQIFMGWLRAQEHRNTIRQFRQHNEAIRDEVLARAQKMLQNKDPAEVLEFLANTLTNKLTHAPIQHMNQAAHTGNDVLLANAKTLFNLTDES